MKWLFYVGIFLLLLFEAANVYFIMPMPGSQRQDSLALAYFLYSYRWIIRGLIATIILLGMWKSSFTSKIAFVFSITAAIAIIWLTNFKMAADHMFLTMTKVDMKNAEANKVGLDRLIIGIENNGEARAYPIQFLGYHHQVRDTIGGLPIMVTYCTVCRSGRVFQPIVRDQYETFRLVGMDHFNAMFEDKTTKSWWRQETGEAVAGRMKGEQLPEWPSTQTSLRMWLQWHPTSLILQPDSTFQEAYEDESDFEAGRLEGKLTVYDTASWHDKSWIAGVIIGTEARAYDWNELKRKKIIHDVLQSQPIIVVVGDDHKSLTGFRRISDQQQFVMHGDTLNDGTNKYDLRGQSIDNNIPDLVPFIVYQEYWHSWRTFHPHTTRFE